ncbi:Uncharacterised protein [uncultured archaeon]|nr:Uncharacterised protein [uncultured archaeon]
MFRSGSLIEDYYKFNLFKSGAAKTNELDLSTTTWFYPMLLLLLGIFIKQNPDINVIPPRNPSVSNYFDIITKSDEADVNKSYIPIIKVPENSRKLDTQKLNRYATYCGGTTTLQYLIGELTTNIYEHSSFSTAYIMGQKYYSRGFLEFCIVDNGVSIPKSYEIAGMTLENDKIALDYVLKGISTKKEYKDGERGHGLRSSIDLTTGIGGTCLIISRNGGLSATPEKTNTFTLDGENIYEGTLISIDVPFQESEVNIYDHLPK